MKKVHISFLHNLDNNEFGIFYSKLLELIKDREFVDPTLTNLQSSLQSHRKNVLCLNNRVQKFNDTEKINELTRLRTEYLISFRLGIKSKMLWYDAEMRLAGERLYAWLKQFKKKPFIQSIITQDVAISNMLNSIRQSESLKADIALLSLDKLIDAIDDTTKQVELYLKYRRKEKLLRKNKGRVKRDAAYEDIRKLVNYIESKLSLMNGNVEESEHYILLWDLHWELKNIRKDFRIRTAKDKTRREKEALKKLKQLESAKEAEMKQTGTAEQTPQPKVSNIELTETLLEPPANGALTQKAIEAPVKSNKQKGAKAKTKVSRRKIKKMLV